ncbi:acetate--CoA ligase family protein [candidate division KSB1 bacterium]|nr:acetate--CoA ligase family protein [candidate division KSB1 bacterium]
MFESVANNPKNLKHIFYPDSIAVIGANKIKGTVPCDILLNILGANFQGVVYPVSPREKYIACIKSYKYVIDIEDPVELAVLVFPSSVCHLALEQCGQKGIKAAIIISAGFKETGSAGMEREEVLKAIAKKYNISFIGPNCLGVINTDPGAMLNASFARKMPEQGPIAFLSQSGALCTAVLDYARTKHIGFSKFVSFGNKADISEIDLLYYLKDDPKTKVILIYLEEISDGPALMKAAQDVIRDSGKPILALKSGRTSEGASAAASHTGSLAASDAICDAAFKQAGIIRCDDIEEMFNIAIAMTYQPLPRNNRIAIVTNAGGPGVLTTDAAIKKGLKLAKFSENTSLTLKKSLPKTANTKNPVDVIGDARADRYNVAVSSALKDPNVDGVFVILTPQSMTDIETIAREVCKIAGQSEKPLYASFMGEADVATGIKILQRNKIPHYVLPESMCHAFAIAYQFGVQLTQQKNGFQEFSDVDKSRAQDFLNQALNEEKTYLPEDETVRILEAYGLPVVPNGLAATSEAAVGIAQKIGYPVVMKIMSEDIVHKFDVQGIVLNIQSSREAENAFNTIISNVQQHLPTARIKGVLVEEMIPSGQEVILGVKRDPAFGPVIMFGLGGIFVEVFKDVNFKIAPVDRTAARAMIDEIKASAILTGTRGVTPRDIESLQTCIQRLSQLAVECPQIKELDINPLIVLEKDNGCFVADAKIML